MNLIQNNFDKNVDAQRIHNFVKKECFKLKKKNYNSLCVEIFLWFERIRIYFKNLEPNHRKSLPNKIPTYHNKTRGVISFIINKIA